jgi:hypothetical protein
VTTLERDFREAWLGAEGDTFASRLARQSLEASAEQDPQLALVLFELKNRFQAELDLHLGGASVKDHRADAADFADLVRGIADAVKEVTKVALGRSRMSPGLLVSSPMPGSVRVILSAAAPAEVGGHLAAARTETQDSNSLRVIATLLARAGDDADSSTNVIEGLLTALPVKAWPGIRRVALAVSASNWEVTGELRRPTEAPVELTMNKSGARQLLDALDNRDSETTTVTLTGIVDGQRRSHGTMWFVSTTVPPVEASVVQQALLDDVAALGASGSLAEATFTVVSKFPPGARGAARRSYVLTQIHEVSVPVVDVTP